MKKTGEGRKAYAEQLRKEYLKLPRTPSLAVTLPSDKDRQVTSVVANQPVRGDEWIREAMR